MPFPELRSTKCTDPRWDLRLTDVAPAHDDLCLLGHDEVEKNICVRLFSFAGGYRIQFDDTGIFDVHDAGSRILWTPFDEPAAHKYGIDVVGRVLPVALHASGIDSLHGSAIAWPDRAIGFLAPKLSGKSTLAMALVNAGARLLTDDTLPVDMTTPVMARPGVHSVRLWRDSVDRLFDRDAPAASTDDNKHVIADHPEDRLSYDPVQLAALYILDPVEPDVEPACHREALDSVESTIALVTHSKLGSILGKSEAKSIFSMASWVAERVPVYRLEVADELDRMPEVVSRICEWHAPETVSKVATHGWP